MSDIFVFESMKKNGWMMLELHCGVTLFICDNFGEERICWFSSIHQSSMLSNIKKEKVGIYYKSEEFI